MIRGLISFFTSGAFLNPMVLCGLVLGIVINATLSYEEIYAFYTDYHVYLFALFLSFLYVFFFKRTYKSGGYELDYVENGVMILFGAIKFVFSSMMTVSFIIMIAF
ncbi:MAG: hypothetical protein PHE89_03195 [Alphaproteobacteria bacterium]|nr:hypothetical protein [Alphaproteobacteria bacterium]